MTSTVRDPGPLFADAAGGQIIVEDDWDATRRSAYDLVLAVGTLDTVNDLPLALRLVRHSMRDDGLLIGAMSGGDTLARAALRDARGRRGRRAHAAPHVHPRIEASALAPLLGDAGFRSCRSSMSIGCRSPIHRSTGWSATCAQWARPTSLQSRARASVGRAAREPPHCVRLRRRRRVTNGGDLRNPPFRRLDDPRQGLRRPLTVSLGRVVNSADVTPAAWTWTRGGWRDRYPNKCCACSAPTSAAQLQLNMG